MQEVLKSDISRIYHEDIFKMPLFDAAVLYRKIIFPAWRYYLPARSRRAASHWRLQARGSQSDAAIAYAISRHAAWVAAATAADEAMRRARWLPARFPPTERWKKICRRAVLAVSRLIAEIPISDDR